MSERIDMFAGDHKAIDITCRDLAENVVDITGSTVVWKVKRKPGAVAVISKSTAGGGIALTDPTNGVFRVTLNPEDTAQLYGDYVHEAEVTDSTSRPSTVIQGPMRVRKTVI